jgi:hypothetical protein
VLRITIPDVELYDEVKGEFITLKGQTLQLEHSLVSLSKWESKWQKPYLTSEEKTLEETLDYIRCMTITQNVNPDIYKFVTNENLTQIKEYIEAPMTATWFSEDKNNTSGRNINGEQVTSELIYYWMVALTIPFKCEKWHLNRLITLIKICNIKNQPPKRRSKREIMGHTASLNAARRKRYDKR